MRVEADRALAPLTTLCLGGPAQYFVSAHNDHGVREAMWFARERNLPIYVLGGGSNTLIADAGIAGLVLKLDMHGITFTPRARGVVEVIAAAGDDWDALVSQAVARGLWGIENLSHIPGSVGAAPVQNIGAYGQELSQTLAWVEAFDTHTDTFVRLDKNACAFAYRDSIFKSAQKDRYIIVRVCLRLNKNGAPNISYPDLQKYFKDNQTPLLQEVRDAVIAIRAQKFPSDGNVGTAGSFFKNPIITQVKFNELRALYPTIPGFAVGNNIKVPLAWILEYLCKAKGRHIGHVGCFKNQPLVLVTYPGACTAECIAFAQNIAHEVYEKTSIVIEPEVTLWGLTWQ